MNIIISDPQGFQYGVEFDGTDWIQSATPTHLAILPEIPPSAGTYNGKIKYSGMEFYSESSSDADISFYPEDEGSFSETLELASDAATVEINVEGIGGYAVDFFSKEEAEDDGNHIYGTDIEALVASVSPEAFILSQLNRELEEATKKHPELSGIQNLTVELDGASGNISFDLIKKTSQIVDGVEVKL